MACLVGGACSSSGTTSAPSSSSSERPSEGAAGIGDPYFPTLGNGGYDVAHYDLELKVDPTSGAIEATATIGARAGQPLTRFDLDLRDLTVGSVTVDGAKAKFEHRGGELVITPAATIDDGAVFTTAVTYEGIPRAIDTRAVDGVQVGWRHDDDGVVVMSEPDGASTWFPGNDHPRDKATFTVHVTVPAGMQVVANGTLRSTETTPAGVRWTYGQDDPMATYLATVLIGHL
ncbi:MAG: hypothetical protein QOF63_3992, partial [Thermoanaerobaculia bacterium]|nr:hypothetical protein [Thermoanaerobaculia bacterium]